MTAEECYIVRTTVLSLVRDFNGAKYDTERSILRSWLGGVMELSRELGVWVSVEHGDEGSMLSRINRVLIDEEFIEI